MTTNKTYEQILANMPPGLERSVLRVLSYHIGGHNRIDRKNLVQLAFNAEWSETRDRQVREAIAKLQLEYPILSDSGAGGYWIASDYDEVEAYAAEIDSRAKDLLEKSRSLRAIAERTLGTQMRLV